MFSSLNTTLALFHNPNKSFSPFWWL